MSFFSSACVHSQMADGLTATFPGSFVLFVAGGRVVVVIVVGKYVLPVR